LDSSVKNYHSLIHAANNKQHIEWIRNESQLDALQSMLRNEEMKNSTLSSSFGMANDDALSCSRVRHQTGCVCWLNEEPKRVEKWML
jgi:hypothetical protein